MNSFYDPTADRQHVYLSRAEGRPDDALPINSGDSQEPRREHLSQLPRFTGEEPCAYEPPAGGDVGECFHRDQRVARYTRRKGRSSNTEPSLVRQSPMEAWRVVPAERDKERSNRLKRVTSCKSVGSKTAPSRRAVVVGHCKNTRRAAIVNCCGAWRNLVPAQMAVSSVTCQPVARISVSGPVVAAAISAASFMPAATWDAYPDGASHPVQFFHAESGDSEAHKEHNGSANLPAGTPTHSRRSA